MSSSFTTIAVTMDAIIMFIPSAISACVIVKVFIRPAYTIDIVLMMGMKNVHKGSCPLEITLKNINSISIMNGKRNRLRYSYASRTVLLHMEIIN